MSTPGLSLAILLSLCISTWGNCIDETKCSSKYNPVCGTDGRTYPNKCWLEKAKKCYHLVDLEVDYFGLCPVPPSRLILKSENSERSVSVWGRCIDGIVCTAEYAPVCGTDGRTYPNKCWLEAAKKCYHLPDLEVDYAGLCPVPPTNLHLKKRETSPNEINARRCIDEVKCSSAKYDPVCGTDGRTYPNRCWLEAAKKCYNLADLKVDYHGFCPVPPKLYLRNENAPLEINARRCIDEVKCSSAKYDPVCGTDGRTYPNRCWLEAAKKCYNLADLKVDYHGFCPVPPKLFLRSENTPQEINARRCIDEVKCSSAKYDPVCGTDGRTYPNRCWLEAAKKCYNLADLKVDYHGFCPVPPKLYLRNENAPLEINARRCIDEVKCSSAKYDPVCGTDGRTYPNRCWLEAAKKCYNLADLKVDYHGFCPVPPTNLHLKKRETSSNEINARRCIDEVACSSAKYDPVCGTDGRTYPNRCWLEAAKKCYNLADLKVDYHGFCPVPPKLFLRNENAPLEINARRCIDEVKCSSAKYDPVCGTDGRTYPNRCWLEAAKKCYNLADLKVDYHGFCPVPPKLFLRSENSPQEINARRCIDEVKCSSAKYDPVCGTDGRTYPNRCWLEAAKKCYNLADLKVDYHGFCPVPPKLFLRNVNAPLEINARRCIDEVKCSSAKYDPVCGTDGRTYPNRCWLEAAKKCYNLADLKVDYPGFCPVPPSKLILESEKCPPYAANHICPLIYDPVCASDGKTYASTCDMCVAMYIQQEAGVNILLTVDYPGICPVPPSKLILESEKCPPYAKNHICPDIYDPVCASDGKTYASACDMCVAMYIQQEAGINILLTVVSKGPCVEKKEKDICSSEHNNGICTKEMDPVCGSDGKTYDNKCLFCLAQQTLKENGGDDTLEFQHFGACKNQRKVRSVVFELVCDPSMRTGLCTREYAPVCGNDGKTYGNTCVYCYSKYKKESDPTETELKAKHLGECKPEDYCPEFSKSGACPYDYNPVCASDGQTYPNLCSMCAEMYAKRKKGEDVTLKVSYEGACENIAQSNPSPRSISSRTDNPGCTRAVLNIQCTQEEFPLCGSDGKTYSNACKFCKGLYNLLDNKDYNLTVKHLGECKPEDYCPPMSRFGACPYDYNPVCASDGKTYPNLCSMCVEMFSKQSEGKTVVLKVNYEGKCKHILAMNLQIEQFKCNEMSKKGICTLEFFPICGKDGKTYANKCTFCYAQYLAEKDGHSIQLDYHGECKSKMAYSVASNEIECLPRMLRGICTKEYYPVCGSDGKTYSNKCHFCFAQHQKQQNGDDITVDHFGKCEEKKLMSNVVCDSKVVGGLCTNEFDPVCGNDGATYGNLCHFCQARHGKDGNDEHLTVDHSGECEPRFVCPAYSKKGVCPYINLPVCASDGRTYSNECVMCAEMYKRQAEGENIILKAMHPGDC